MLFPEEELILLLGRDVPGQELVVQPVTGVYWVQGGYVEAIEGSPVAPPGLLKTSEFIALIERAVLETGGGSQ
jgi:hypothetical protein